MKMVLLIHEVWNFIKQTLFWQWMRLPGDVVFAVGALLMAYDFLIKLQPFFPRAAKIITGKVVYDSRT
jgi:hypothetical protein